MNIWLAIKIQSVIMGTLSFFAYKIFSFLFFASVNDEEKESIEKNLGKPVRNHVIFFYINAILMKLIMLATIATFIATFLKDII